ncbi:MAG TPA: hypothetical protein VKR56_09355 [Candidatus Cybelea sp.]|nr:hypothetical protein [Candidatus Cybelea sp.]
MFGTLGFYGRSLTVAATAATAVLAGCGGSQTANPAMQLNPQVHAPVSWALGPNSSSLSDDARKCNGGGPVKLTPCRIHFTKLSDQAVAVSVKYPGDPKGTLTETDNCGDRATVTGSGGSWTVTPGTKRRRCKAVFAYSSNGKEHGSAVLRIDNRDVHKKH